MNSLSDLLSLPEKEKSARGLLHTPGEIAQQPATWRGTLARFEQYRPQLQEFLRRAGVTAAPHERPTVFLIGAGTSDYIGTVLAPLLRQRWGCEVQAVPSTSLLSGFRDFLVKDRRYLWISFSRSGDSPEGVAVLEHGLEHYPEIAQMVITCNPESRMAEISRGRDNTLMAVLDDVVNDRGLAMTSSFTNMVIFGQCLAHAMELDTYRPILEQLAAAGESLLPVAAARAAKMAQQPFSRMCFVGSGALAGTAKESALKVLEMTAGGIITVSETVLGLRHGPMAVLNHDTAFVLLASSDQQRRNYEIDLLREIGTKGIAGVRLVVGPAGGSDAMAAVCDDLLEFQPTVPDEYLPPVSVLLGQLLGLYCSIERGIRPDAPSPQGVISRVVESFQIYR